MSDFLKGRNFIVVPRLTTTQRNALTATNGMLVYDTTANAFYKYENGAWGTFAGGTAYSRTVVSGNLTAVNDTDYTLVASATFTDPTPVEGKGYTVLVRNGTATLGGNSYSTVGQLLWRAYHSGAWATYQLVTQTQLDAKQDSLGFTPENSANKKTSLADNSDTFYPTQKAVKTAVDAKQDIPFAKSTTSVTTSSTSEVLMASVLIPANTITSGDKLTLDGRFTKTGLNGTSQPVIRIHTSATAGAGNKIAPGVSSFGASTIYIHYLKEGAVKSATNTEFGSQGLVNDLSSSTAAAASYNIDWTVDQYVNFCGLVSSASDVLVLSEYTIYIE